MGFNHCPYRLEFRFLLLLLLRRAKDAGVLILCGASIDDDAVPILSDEQSGRDVDLVAWNVVHPQGAHHAEPPGNLGDFQMVVHPQPPRRVHRGLFLEALLRFRIHREPYEIRMFLVVRDLCLQAEI